ncbi:MAG TPA: lytic transglycosylase domain-containing protein, partial [Thiotrichaceae bacterium]|nr:lytic transglycosylase domain-containing protein [Thiotrichaceae bacterium]
MLKKRLTPFIVMGLLLNTLAHARTSSCITGDAAYLLEKSQPYLVEITAAAKKHKVDPHLIRSVIAIESCYNKKAVSHAGAQGLMQLMPATAERFGVDDSFDSKQNVFAGARYLRYLHLRFKGDLSKILAGYNAGEGRVDRYNGVPPYKET